MNNMDYVHRNFVKRAAAAKELERLRDALLEIPGYTYGHSVIIGKIWRLNGFEWAMATIRGWKGGTG